ncbi:Zinc finger protein-like 1 homolog [Linum perenne]
MVVCKCRKATKLYCFVHKVPVCGECISFPEHQICVVRTYSEWVIDGGYDWPPKCCSCQAVLDEGSGETTRLGCMHVIHTNCLVSHVQSFPPHTAPAGYVCPSCSIPIWPPKNVKDSGSSFHSKLKEAIIQTGIEKNLFGNHPVSFPAPPPAFVSDPLVSISSSSLSAKDDPNNLAEGYSNISGKMPSMVSVPDIVEVDSPSSAANYLKNSSPAAVRDLTYISQPGATTRKGGIQIDRQNSDMSYYEDDEDGNRKKYSRRGPIQHKFLRALLPFWSSALPTLPVTAPPRKDGTNADDNSEVRARHHRSSRMDPRKILLFIAIMACMATMGILYYRIAQSGFGDEPGDEQQ